MDTPETRHNFSNYLAEITYLDGQVGECLRLLEKHQVSDNTLVIFTSEQGSGFPFAKWTCYDNGLQNALIASWPGKIKPGQVSDAMIEYVDVVPTFVSAAGGKPAQGAGWQKLPPGIAGPGQGAQETRLWTAHHARHHQRQRLLRHSFHSRGKIQVNPKPDPGSPVPERLHQERLYSGPGKKKPKPMPMQQTKSNAIAIVREWNCMTSVATPWNGRTWPKIPSLLTSRTTSKPGSWPG